MKNRIASISIVVLMVAGALALSFHQPAPQQVAESIDGNGTLAPAPENYAFVALKLGDAASQKLAADFASSPKFVALHKLAACKTYAEGDAYLRNNLKPIQTLPAVVVMHGNEIVYKRSGANVCLASSDVDTCFPKLRPHPRPKPEPKPEPDEPKVPEHPDVTPEAPDVAPVANTPDPLKLLVVAVVCFAVGHVLMFKRGMN